MSEAPRWRLVNAHYLKVPVLQDGTEVEWEHKETNRTNGRSVRKLFPVPMLLDTNDPSDYNYPGEIIVAHEGDNANRNDYIFIGDPTPEMEPLNEAAQAISDSMRHRWDHPINSLAVSGQLNPQESAFMEQMMKAFSSAPNQSVPKADYDALKDRLTKLEAMLAAQQPVPEQSTARRA